MGKVFIGRAHELRELKAGLGDALSGHGCLFMVAGEAGIGKTRLAEELASEAAQRGALVLWGRCWEGGGAPAYWPWLQITRTYLRGRDGDFVAAQLGEGTRDLAQIVPELRDVVSGVPAVVPLDPDDASFRLFDGYASFLKNVAAVQPLVLIIDDLHDADPPSLRLLHFVVRELRAAPILAIATYREVEVRHTPLRELVGALVRGSRGIALRGLNGPEVRQLVEQALPVSDARVPSISDALVGAIHAATDGNPFFIDAIVRALLIEGDLDGSGAAAVERLRIPDQAREMLRERLRLLPARVVEVLSIAAVIGREFDSRVVELVDGGPATGPIGGVSVPLLDLLGRAVESGVLIEVPDVPGRYSFTHPLMRETVYDDISPPRRIHFHRGIGEALAALDSTRGDANVEAIAHHFYQAAAHGCAPQALEYSVRAAARATAMLAYDEAVRHWEHAVEALEIGGEDATVAQPLELRRCELLLGLGTALNDGGDRRRAKEVLARGAAVARSAGAAEQLAHAALGFGGGWLGYAEMAKMEEPGAAGADETLSGLVTDALHALGETSSALRARLLSLLAREGYFTMPMAERVSLMRQATDVARRSGDFATLAEVLIETHVAIWGPDTMRERLEMAGEALRLAQLTGQLQLESGARYQGVVTLLELGDHAAFEREATALTRFAERTRIIGAVWSDKVRMTMQALLTGRYDDAEWLMSDAVQAGRRADLGAAIAHSVQLVALRREQARLTEFTEMAGLWKAMVAQHPRVTALRAALAFYYAETGQAVEARAELEHLARHDFADLPRDLAFLVSLTQLTEVCVGLDLTTHATSLYQLLLPYAQCNPVEIFGAVCWGSVSRSLGLLATIMGRWEHAQQHFEVALERNRAFGARPWIAHTQLAYASMLLRRATGDDEARALELLEPALAAAEVLKMPRLVDSSRTLLEIMSRRSKPGNWQRDAAPQSARDALPDVPANQFRKDGEYWTLLYEGATIRLKHSRGLTLLAALLREPGREIAATELATRAERNGSGNDSSSHRPQPDPLASGRGDDTRRGLGDAGELLDAQARATYKRRLNDLREELAEAEGFNDTGRSERLREEIDFLTAELSRAVGLGGRERRAGSHAERARVNVTRAIALALAKINESHPALGEHFARTIRTGTFCSYAPDPRAPIDWQT